MPRGKDTVFVSKGGCDHFSISVDIKFSGDHHSITDSTFWIEEALKLAEEFEMDHYRQVIKEGNIRKAQSGKVKVWYDVEDNNTRDNLIYNGIEITFEENGKRISLVQYYN